MKELLIGLTGKDLLQLTHKCVELELNAPIHLVCTSNMWERSQNQLPVQLELLPGIKYSLAVENEGIAVSTHASKQLMSTSWLRVVGQKDNYLKSITLFNQSGTRTIDFSHWSHPCLIGIDPDTKSLRVILLADLESYVSRVIASEIPASFHLEAIKSQTLAARTYALHPRVNHKRDLCQVCDSYLCCQFFSCLSKTKDVRHEQALSETKGEIITFQDNPILALFSSCAGGHTENYETCFSDESDHLFPAKPLPYLKGVFEGEISDSFASFEHEEALKKFWHLSEVITFDAWSPHFKWGIRIPAPSLEAHLHNTTEHFLNDPNIAPFVIPPQSHIFGHIESFSVLKRGIGGTAMELSVQTSKGKWIFKKEIVIRSLFKIPELGLSRLKSARIFFDESREQLGLLKTLQIMGLGWGHGVGLQQFGAEGLARRKKNYRQIIAHYFSNTAIERL